ncbi:uncharacterized protein LOC125656335 [Ostrea edulis]|uniref:uncharacterized protein LOC125656335 n=1 Tax=Ostrea edulis TaxID=37623 RepID=UPI0024AFCCC4|nr:uncharacterized protein LOC125656335 [Ostrea edulis]XP_056001179.1 uncharacterized protein LOC125656335 [Ostrea edulis]XP_056001180.1 uncharacterized protein LOC125656335 [Ostrea edulis]XP_056001181.1 uncharacterized protein LOC125656335 [Ostrea edulis]XP_056001182.1 uncharacterized protein LOC125656335 [Ostrea edulis]XP_056001183.1 uncharacterized protein LOC125656335 [Ostrea edulis]
MASVYASTSETTNANRACRVVLGPCTDGLRDLLRHHVPPLTFPHVIKQNQLNLPRLTPVQRDLILPQHGHYKGNYTDMDISLLYILLRNISGISSHSNGWNRDPDPNDRSLSANIERIRLVRNHCVHSCDPFMSNTDFNSIWSTIRLTMVDLDVFLVNGNKYEKAVDFLRHESMDPENDLHYEEEPRKQVEEDTKTREMVDNLENKLEKLTKSSIPQNVREQYDIDIQKWIEEDKLYNETHSFPSMMEKVRNQPCVTFVGVPGSGKSATAQHIALKLQAEGYEILPTKDVRKIEDYGDPRNPQVFVIDDVVGVFGLRKTDLNVLDKYEQKITQPSMVKSRTLMTCRETVFNETLPYKPFLTKEETVIKLHSSDHALDDNDKKQILQKYGLNVNLMSPALLTSTSRMFPLLSKLFSKEPKLQALGSKFFMNPFQCIIDELDGMQIRNKLNYATLVLCMLNENRLSEDILEDKNNEHFMNMKKKLLKNCRLEHNTDTFKFMDALLAMEGTYTKQCGARYTFIHDSTFEICAYQYGKQFSDQMLQYMSSSYIANNVKIQTSEPGIVNKVKEKQSDSQPIEKRESSDGKDQESDDKNSEREESFDLCIRIREDRYPLLAERLYRDIQNMELYDVFRNQVLKHSQLCQAFIGVLEKKSYAELKALFLSSQGEVDKIASKREFVEEEGEWSEWRRQEVLIGRNYQDDVGETNREYNVRVISWVIYYGHYQILEYIVQQTEQHNEIYELFGITEISPQESESEISSSNKQESENNRPVGQSKSGIFQKIKNKVFNRFRREIMFERSGIDTCDNQENNRPVEQSTSGIYTCNKQESEINILIEERRLLVLSCYSGDVQTVRVLLPVCRKAINGIGQVSEDIDRCHDTPLTTACEEGHVSIVDELVKAGADVNLRDIWENTPLIAACKRGHVSIVDELVKAGADVNLQGKGGNTPLTAACERGHVSIVDELVKAGTDVNLQGKGGNTPLTAACERGHVSIVKELVKAGADVKIQDHFGNTPLTAACERGHVSIVKELVKAGADVITQGKGGNTSLTAACERGHVSIVKELVKAGADVKIQDHFGNTPLTAACGRGHVSIVKELVKAGADVNLRDIWENTPLIAACKRGHVSIVDELVKAGADVNLQGKGGNTPLTAACERGHVSIVDELVKAGAGVNLRGKGGNTPLTAACERGHVSIVKELVKAGADVKIQDHFGNTPLTAAWGRGHVSIVKELVKAMCQSYVNLQNITGADVSLQDYYGNTPLIAACKEGHASIAEELVKAGTDVNLQDDMGNTPLTAVCEEGHVSIVKELVKAGADVNLQDRLGNTLLIAAVRKCPLSTVKYLVEHGADWVTQVVNIYVSAVYKELMLNKPDIMKYLIQEQNKITPGQCNGNVHLFNCLVDIRHAGVKTDSRDDVVVTDRSVWCMYRQGDLWRTISRGDCDVLRHLLRVCLDVNQSIQLYDMFNDYKPGVTPLLYTLIDENGINVSQIMEKVRILLGAGVDVNIRVRYRDYDTVLDREGVSVLEWMRRLVCKYSNSRSMFKYSEDWLNSDRAPEYKRVMCEIKKHVRRHSV